MPRWFFALTSGSRLPHVDFKCYALGNGWTSLFLVGFLNFNIGDCAKLQMGLER